MFRLFCNSVRHPLIEVARNTGIVLTSTALGVGCYTAGSELSTKASVAFTMFKKYSNVSDVNAPTLDGSPKQNSL